jgi:hypothetical protein
MWRKTCTHPILGIDNQCLQHFSMFALAHIEKCWPLQSHKLMENDSIADGLLGTHPRNNKTTGSSTKSTGSEKGHHGDNLH